jgi:undecaprenyl-diphosphatase
LHVLQAIVLGIIQGLTEFLPVSSSAHLDILPRLFGWGDAGTAFTAVIQLGTLGAVLIYFGKDILATLSAILRSFGKKPAAPGDLKLSDVPKPSDVPEVRLFWAVIAGTVPLVLIALALKKYIQGPLREPIPVATMLILMGLALYAVEQGTKKLLRRPLTEITIADGIWVGLMQAFSAIPGSSRSGCTLIGAFARGLNREAALRFSFLLSLPAVLLSGIYSLKDVIKPEAPKPGDPIPTLVFSHTETAIAAVVAFIVGYASIAWMLKYLGKHSTLVFVIYRVLAGIGILIAHSLGKI